MAKIALIHARIIDGTGAPPIGDGVVLVDGQRIEAVGPADAMRIPADCEQRDLAGMTVIPGLFDGHMHVTTFPGLLDADGQVRENIMASEHLRRCLEWGTTTVGHASGCPQNNILRDLINANKLPGRARLLVSGVVTATGGHVRGRASDGPWEVRKGVREMVMAGVDFIKTCATGGFQWAHEGLGQPDYTLEELVALAHEAHMRHKRVHVHAHGRPGLANAIEAGCDVILHGANIDDESLQGIRDRNLWYMPTLYITSRHICDDPRLPRHMTDRMKVASPIHREGVAKAHRMGIRIAAGSDGPPRPGAIMHELVELVGCGLSPMEAILVATRNTADAFGLLDRLGTIEPGKTADLLAIDGDPLADIGVMTEQQRIKLVMKEGRVEVSRG